MVTLACLVLERLVDAVHAPGHVHDSRTRLPLLLGHGGVVPQGLEVIHQAWADFVKNGVGCRYVFSPHMEQLPQRQA
jgi:hypothetical protein